MHFGWLLLSVVCKNLVSDNDGYINADGDLLLSTH